MEVSIIIPAYNEERNISQILTTLLSFKNVFEILIVDDGSTDRTSEIAKSFGFEVLKLTQNMGKSHAMWAGLHNTKSSIVLFLDADLIGITPIDIQNLISPIILNEADMTLGIFTSGRGVTDLAQKIAPFLTGQRACKRVVISQIPQNAWESGFGIEIALTEYAKKSNLRLKNVYLKNASHIMKEEKLGFIKGSLFRLKMYTEILKQVIKIHLIKK